MKFTMKLLALFFGVLMLANVANSDAPMAPSTTVCNGMTMDLVEITAGDTNQVHTLSALLHPGDCASVSGLELGTHTIRFIERSGQRVSVCQREVSLTPGTRIWIAPDDGAQCLY
jgi:hypothetical protein